LRSKLGFTKLRVGEIKLLGWGKEGKRELHISLFFLGRNWGFTVGGSTRIEFNDRCKVVDSELIAVER
jgi:hypothetical protein